MPKFGKQSLDRLTTCHPDLQKVMNEAFVYVWENNTDRRKYIGYHKGHINDNYVSSSHSKDFWNDYNDGKLSRTIIYEGTKEECFELEQFILEEIDFSSGDYYNAGRGGIVIFTDEVRKKISEACKLRDYKNEAERNKKISESRKYVTYSNEARKKIGDAHRNKKLSDKHISILSKNAKGTNNPRATKIICETTGQEFMLMSDAAKEFGISLSMLSQIVNGKRKHKDGLIFKNKELINAKIQQS